MTSVETDMNTNTVTVEFDDEKVAIDSVVSALNGAGYVVQSQKKLE